MQDEFSSYPSHPLSSSTTNNKKYVVGFFLLFLVLCWLPPFDPHRLLLSKPDDAEMLCTLVGISAYHNITGGFISVIGMSDVISVSLYTTTIVRTMICVYAHPPLMERDGQSFSYSRIYINISSPDVNQEIDILGLRYSDPVKLWKYDTGVGYLLRDVTVDRHGFSEEPVDIYKDWLHANIIMKSFVFSLDCLLVLGVYLVAQYKRQK